MTRSVESNVFVPESMRSMLVRRGGFQVSPRMVLTNIARLRRRGRSPSIVVVGECPGSLQELVSISELMGKYKGCVVGFALLVDKCRYDELSSFQATLRNAWKQYKASMLTTDSIEVIRRILNAHVNKAADKLIASANLMGDTLSVWSCEPRMYQVSVKAIPGLGMLSGKALGRFEISESGSYIRWDAEDIDLNLDSIRYFCDPEFRREEEKKRVKEIKSFGNAIRSVREKHNLRQQDCGVTEREVRRIESGEVTPHGSTLTKLATAHEMTLQEYLAQLSLAHSLT